MTNLTITPDLFEAGRLQAYDGDSGNFAGYIQEAGKLFNAIPLGGKPVSFGSLESAKKYIIYFIPKSKPKAKIESNNQQQSFF